MKYKRGKRVRRWLVAGLLLVTAMSVLMVDLMPLLQ